MYGNNFYNPYMHQPYYQASNFARNLTRGSNFTRNSTLANSAINGLGKKTTLGLGSLLGKFSFSNFLNGASKTLNVVNQAIPIFYQVKPIFNNAKTMFRILGAVRNDKQSNETRTTTQNIQQPINNSNINNNHPQPINNNFQEENPTFFI